MTANKEGFHALKATAGGIVGGIILGPLGLVAGAGLAGTASQNKIYLTCLACGHQFTAGSAVVKTREDEKPNDSPNQPDSKRPRSTKIDW